MDRDLRDEAALEQNARALTERLAVLWQASLLLRYAPREVSEAFVAGRLSEDRGHTIGTLPSGVKLRSIVERASPREVSRV